MKDQPPRLRTLDDFVADWRACWAALQPAERTLDSNGKYNAPKPEMDWSYLAKVGANGFLLLMLSLTWWGMLRADNDWQKVITDVTAVLRSLLKRTDTSTSAPSSKGGKAPNTLVSASSSKRKAPDTSTSAPSPKRKAAPLITSDGRSTNMPALRKRVNSKPASKSTISTRCLRQRK